MFVRITQDMQDLIRSAHLCFGATVGPEGRPNVSPKGTIRVWDDHSLSLRRGVLQSHPVSTRIADGMDCRTPDPFALDRIRRGAEHVEK
jgi:Pyridoxamine 5'-phosphate oxidase